MTSMASLSTLSSLYLNQNPSPLRFTSNALPCLRFGSQVFLHPTTNEVRRVSVCRVSSKLIIPNLQAYDFRHPVDLEDGYKVLPNWAEVETVSKFLVPGCVAAGLFPSEKIEADCTSVLAGPTQHSDTYNLMVETAEILNITTPLLYIRNNEVPLARAVGIDIPYVVVNSSLLKLLTPQELQAVFAHELAHLKCGHYALLRYLDFTDLVGDNLPDWVMQQILQQIPLEKLLRLVQTAKELFRWRQATKLSCDRASLLVAQDSKVVISAIMKLAEGYSTTVGEQDVDAYLAAARVYVAASSSVPTERFVNGCEREPVPPVRAYEIDEWSRSKEYAMLLTSATTQGQPLVKSKIKEKLPEQVDMKKLIEKFLEQVDMKTFIEKVLEQI